MLIDKTDSVEENAKEFIEVGVHENRIEVGCMILTHNAQHLPSCD